MKKMIALLLALVMMMSMAACGGNDNNNDEASGVEAGLLRVAASTDINTMDVAQTTDNYMIPMNIFDRLYEVEVQADGSTEIVPSLATDYTVSNDGLTYSFTLREGV